MVTGFWAASGHRFKCQEPSGLHQTKQTLRPHGNDRRHVCCWLCEFCHELDGFGTCVLLLTERSVGLNPRFNQTERELLASARGNLPLVEMTHGQMRNASRLRIVELGEHKSLCRSWHHATLGVGHG